MPPGSGAVRGTAVSRTLLLDRVGWNMAFLKPKQAPVPQVDFERLPRHVAIIMDGNGRWAKKRGLPRTAGHAAGAALSAAAIAATEAKLMTIAAARIPERIFFIGNSS